MTEILKIDVLGKDKELVLLVGLPYSGKSTYAKSMHDPVVNPDAIRVALHGQKFVGSMEPYVWAIAKSMVKALFLSGHNVVILDATNTTKERRKEWLSRDWRTFIKVIPTDKTKCIERANNLGDDIIIPIIDSDHSQ
jgi:predicted kinase